MSKTPTLSALLWDVDGTLAETERDGHRVAFNRAFAEAGLSWNWDVERYGELLKITGGRERLLHDMSAQPDAPASAGERETLSRQLHAAKNRHYAELVAEAGLQLREGVQGLIEEAARAGLRQGIVTTTSRVNVEALLRPHLGRDWQRHFAVCVCGEDVRAKKPDPEAYQLALKALQLSPLQALALEDSPGGLAAGRAAGIATVVTRSIYFGRSTFDGAVAIGPGLHARHGWRPTLDDAADEDQPVRLADLQAWWTQRDSITDMA